jgi:hypothetical protein
MMQLDDKIARSPKRKKLTITVGRDRSVIVHAPEGTSEETVRRVWRPTRAISFMLGRVARTGLACTKVTALMAFGGP